MNLSSSGDTGPLGFHLSTYSGVRLLQFWMIFPEYKNFYGLVPLIISPTHGISRIIYYVLLVPIAQTIHNTTQNEICSFLCKAMPGKRLLNAHPNSKNGTVYNTKHAYETNRFTRKWNIISDLECQGHVQIRKRMHQNVISSSSKCHFSAPYQETPIPHWLMYSLTQWEWRERLLIG